MRQVESFPSAYVLHLMLMFIGAATEGTVIVSEVNGSVSIGMFHGVGNSGLFHGSRSHSWASSVSVSKSLAARRRLGVYTVHGDLGLGRARVHSGRRRLPTGQAILANGSDAP
jgi:hypothetical protein